MQITGLSDGLRDKNEASIARWVCIRRVTLGSVFKRYAQKTEL